MPSPTLDYLRVDALITHDDKLDNMEKVTPQYPDITRLRRRSHLPHRVNPATIVQTKCQVKTAVKPIQKPMAKPDVIVSLTTWRGRIFHEDFPFNLYSLLSQETKYRYKVVLVLSEEEFGKDFQLPQMVEAYRRAVPNFEVLWTYRNTKALKNYNPTSIAYPNTPIIVIGDDTIYSNKLVDTVYNAYLKSDRKSCMAARVSGFPSGLKVPWRIRLFPPKCMKWIDEDYFVKYFHDNNDLFYGVRLLLNNTKVIRMNWDGLWIPNSAFSQENRLTEYHKYNDDEVFYKFISEHPEYKN